MPKTIHLYEFFRGPGLRYDSKEDLPINLRNKNNSEQQQTTSSVNNEEADQQDKRQLTTVNDENQNSSDRDPSAYGVSAEEQSDKLKNGEEWDESPYMKPEIYGYRLCSSKEMNLFKKEHKKAIQKKCVACSDCCC